MTLALTKRGRVVFDGFDGAGAPRQVSNEDAQTWSTEIERGVEDAVSLAGLAIRWTSQTVRVRSTGNVAIATALEDGDTLNGVVLATGDYVFLGSQTDPAENGIYTVVASGAASRATWADSAAELDRLGFFIQEGTVGAGERWVLPLEAADITVDTTALNFAQIGAESDLGDLDARLDAAEADIDDLETAVAAIEPGADVTDAVNVGSSIHGATGKTTPVDADTVPLIDSAASNVLKKVTWANIKATLKAYFDTLYYIVGGADVAVADGGTGASTAANARTNLGLVIGTDVQAHSAVLDATTASFTTADETKLDGIEAAADVTDAGNVGSSIFGATAKTTLADADTVAITDSAASNVLKKITWANVKTAIWTALGALIAGGSGKATPVDADTLALSDSADTNATKKLTWANVKATLKTYFDPLYLNQDTTGSAATLTTPRTIDGQAFDGSANITVIAPGTFAAASKATPVDADKLPLVDSAASNVLKHLTWANLKATFWTSFGALIAAGTNKAAPVTADTIALADSEAASASKKATLAVLPVSTPQRTAIDDGDLSRSLIGSPGDAPRLFTDSLEAPLDPLDTANIVTLASGNAYRQTGPGIVAQRYRTRIRDGESYLVQYIASRTVAPADPAGDAIRFGVAWFDKDDALISTTVIHDITDLGVATEDHTHTIVDTDAPATAVYFSTYVQVYGAAETVTYIQRIESHVQQQFTGDLLRPDAWRSTDGPREDFDDEAHGFVWADDTVNPVEYWEHAEGSGHWVGPLTFSGPAGPAGQDGVTTTISLFFATLAELQAELGYDEFTGAFVVDDGANNGTYIFDGVDTWTKVSDAWLMFAASNAETIAGVIDDKSVVPSGLKAALDDRFGELESRFLISDVDEEWALGDPIDTLWADAVMIEPIVSEDDRFIGGYFSDGSIRLFRAYAFELFIGGGDKIASQESNYAWAATDENNNVIIGVDEDGELQSADRLKILDAQNREQAIAWRSETMTQVMRLTEYGILVGYPSQSNGNAAEAWPAILSAERIAAELADPIPGAYHLDGDVRPQNLTGAGWTPMGAGTLTALSAEVRDGVDIMTQAEAEALTAGALNAGQCASVSACALLRTMMDDTRGVASDGTNKLVVIEPGVGGTNILQLSKPPANTYDATDRYSRFTDGLTEALAAIEAASPGAEAAVVASLEVQGESDMLGAGATTYATYKAARALVWDDMDGDTALATGQARRHAKFPVMVGGGYTTNAGSDGVHDLFQSRAMLDLSHERDDVFIPCPIYPYMDKINHLAANGQLAMGLKIAEAMHQVLVLRKRWRPLEPLWIERKGRVFDIGFATETALQFAAYPYNGATYTIDHPSGAKNQYGFWLGPPDDPANASLFGVTSVSFPRGTSTIVRVLASEDTAEGTLVGYTRDLGAGTEYRGNGNLCNSKVLDPLLLHKFLTGMYGPDFEALEDTAPDMRDWAVPFVYAENWER